MHGNHQQLQLQLSGDIVDYMVPPAPQSPSGNGNAGTDVDYADASADRLPTKMFTVTGNAIIGGHLPAVEDADDAADEDADDIDDVAADLSDDPDDGVAVQVGTGRNA